MSRVYAVRDHTFMDGVAVYVWPESGYVWTPVHVEIDDMAPGERADAFIHLPMDIAEKLHEALGEALGYPPANRFVHDTLANERKRVDKLLDAWIGVADK